MNHRMLLIVVLLSSFLFGQSESNSSAWKNMVKKTKKEFSFSILPTWRDFTPPHKHPIYMFEASGTIFNQIYNDGPLIVTVFIDKISGNNLTEIKNSTIEGYFQNPDRVFEKNHKPIVDSTSILSGEKAYVISTRFYRTSKGLFQNRYDLCVFSDKFKKGWFMTLSIQHNDSTYTIADKLLFLEIAKKIYGYFELSK